MPFYAIDPDDTTEVYLKQDKKVSRKLKACFSIKVLNVLEATKLQGFLIGFNEALTNQEAPETEEDGRETVVVFSGLIDELEAHARSVIKGWKNLKTSTKKSIKFSEDSIMKVLPLPVVAELLSLALSSGVISEEDAGN